MSDLSDRDLDHCLFMISIPDAYAMFGRAIAEIRRRRAEQATGREHVEHVVMEEVVAIGPRLSSTAIRELAPSVAHRVADRLSVPVLNEKVRRGLILIKAHFDDDGHNWAKGIDMEDVESAFAWIDSLITARKP